MGPCIIKSLGIAFHRWGVYANDKTKEDLAL